jgi:hypothetical protein
MARYDPDATDDLANKAKRVANRLELKTALSS